MDSRLVARRASSSSPCRASGRTATGSSPRPPSPAPPRSSSRGPSRDAVLDALGDVTVLAVPDGLVALGALAAGWRARFDPLVVGVTGSIAKTSTKEAIAAVLGTAFRTLRTEGNQNNEIGLPLTLLRLGPDHRAVVLEMGMYAGGEIADLARLARPRIGVVTAVHGVHLSRMGSIAAIEQAKGELVEALPVGRRRGPQPGRPARPPDGRPNRGAGPRPTASAPTPTWAPRTSPRPASTACASRSGSRRRRGGRPIRLPARIPGLGKLSVHNALAGRRGRPRGGHRAGRHRPRARRRLVRGASRPGRPSRAGSRSSTTPTTPRRRR